MPSEAQARITINKMLEDADRIIEAAHEIDPVERNTVDAADSRTWTAFVSEAQQRVEARREPEIPEIILEAEPDLGLSWE